MPIPIYTIIAYNAPEEAAKMLYDLGYGQAETLEQVEAGCRDLYENNQAKAIELFMAIHPDREAFEYFVLPRHITECKQKYGTAMKKLVQKNRGEKRRYALVQGLESDIVSYLEGNSDKYKVPFKAYAPYIFGTIIALTAITVAVILISKKASNANL